MKINETFLDLKRLYIHGSIINTYRLMDWGFDLSKPLFYFELFLFYLAWNWIDQNQTKKNRNMKIVMTLAVLFMTTAIFAQNPKGHFLRNQVKSKTVTEVDLARVYEKVSGTVRMDAPCGMYISVPVEGKVFRLRPVNLPKEFQVDGENIRFDYKEVGKVEDCKIDNEISVSNVQVAKESVKRIDQKQNLKTF